MCHSRIVNHCSYLWITGSVGRKELHFKHRIIMMTNNHKVVAAHHICNNSAHMYPGPDYPICTVYIQGYKKDNCIITIITIIMTMTTVPLMQSKYAVAANALHYVSIRTKKCLSLFLK